MELTLKNVKVNDQMSDETICFSASIYIDGGRAGTVHNRGCGGSHEIDWTDRSLGKGYEAWLKGQPVPFETYDGKIELLDNLHDKLEVTINEALDVFEQTAWLKRQCKTKTLFKLKDKEDPDNPDQWWVIPASFNKLAKMRLRQMYGDNLGEIANERFV